MPNLPIRDEPNLGMIVIPFGGQPTRANAGRSMCEKCKLIDDRIERYKDLARRINDQQTLDGIKRLIQELEAQKPALHE